MQDEKSFNEPRAHAWGSLNDLLKDVDADKCVFRVKIGYRVLEKELIYGDFSDGWRWLHR